MFNLNKNKFKHVLFCLGKCCVDSLNVSTNLDRSGIYTTSCLVNYAHYNPNRNIQIFGVKT
jgi:hypothetical protein